MDFPAFLPRSWTGTTMAVIYLIAAVYVAQDEVRHTGGGWINLRGLGTNILTAPSQLALGPLLAAVGVPRINFHDPGVSGYAQLALHILVTAALLYLIGWGGEWVVRRLAGRS